MTTLQTPTHPPAAEAVVDAATAAEPETNGTGSGQPPVHREQFGNVTAAAWQNTTDDGQTYYACTLTRVYRDEASGEWRDSNGFGARDLLAVHVVSLRMAEWIDAAQRRERRQAREQANGSHVAADAQSRGR